MEDSSDLELIQRVLDGDDSAFRPLVDRYHRAIYSTARRMLRDHDAADEVAQETFVRAYFALARYDSHYRFYTWLLRIALNLCYDDIKRNRRQAPLDESLETGNEEDPIDAMARGRDAARIRREVDNLPPDQRKIILLRMDGELSYQEIGKLLKIPIGTVMSRLYRAKRTLAQNLKDLIE